MKPLYDDFLEDTLSADVTYPKKVSSPFRWKKSAVVSFIVITLIAGWFSHADLFSIPKDVRQSRNLYFSAKREIEQDPIYWREHRLFFEKRLERALLDKDNNEILQLIQSITPHTLTDVLSEETSSLTITPKLTTSSLVLVATKPERLFWPFSTMLSLEIELRFEQEGVSAHFIRLRRGSQEFSPTLAWSYFGPDLERLKKSNHPLLSKTP